MLQWMKGDRFIKKETEKDINIFSLLIEDFELQNS
jgi:hypothetical protein